MSNENEIPEHRQRCDKCGERTLKEALEYFSSDTLICNFCLFPFLKDYKKLIDFATDLIYLKSSSNKRIKSIALEAEKLINNIKFKEEE